METNHRVVLGIDIIDRHRTQISQQVFLLLCVVARTYGLLFTFVYLLFDSLDV